MDNNIEIENNEKKDGQKTVSFFRLYRFCEGVDIVILIFAILMSAAVGVAQPINMLIYRNVINLLVGKNIGNSYAAALRPSIHNFAIIAASTFVAGFIQHSSVNLLLNRLGRRYRCKFYQAMLRQDVAWFDKQQTGRLVTKMTDDIETVETAITEKIVQFIQQICTFVTSLVIAFTNDYRLTLIGMTILPIMVFIFLFLFRFIKRFAVAQIKAYSYAGGVAEEILSGLRTVVAFNAMASEVKRYTANLKLAEKYGIKRSVCQGIASGCLGMAIWSVGAVLYYAGLQFLKDGTTDGGRIILVFFTVVMGSIAMGNTIPSIDNILQAKAAGYVLFEIIDRVPDIDSCIQGKIPNDFNGDIEFKNISFKYPTRPDVQVLKNFSFTIRQGQTVAFVGASGCGKSTIMHMLQRFYDPDSGSVSLGGENLKNLDLTWFRSKIGVVQQEPKLFNGTIRDNILMGKLSATEEELIKAAKEANAYDFIRKTREGFETVLGDMGSGFSGGQKQRLAIATALIRDPELLLLDEATSALDTVSEKLVQQTIDRAILSDGDGKSCKRTVVMIAHRLQTVRKADVIVVMKSGGEIVEQGSHAELVAKRGAYWEMLQKQGGEGKDEEETTDAEAELEHTQSMDERRFSRTLSFADDVINMRKKLPWNQVFIDIYQLMKLNRPECKYIVLGVLMSVIIGLVFPCGALLMSQLYEVFTYVHTDIDKFNSMGTLVVCLLLVPAVCLLIGNLFKNVGFGVSGESLTTRLREKMFESILKQEMAWFDEPINQPGALTGRLALEATLVKGAAGLQLGIMVEAAANVIAALTIGFFFSWELALLFFVFVPLITMSGILQGRNMKNATSAEVSDSSKNTTVLALETLNNVRFVHSLGLQQHFYDKYIDMFKESARSQYGSLFLYGIFGGLGVCSTYLSFCIIFLVGGILMDHNRLVMINLMRVFACLNMSSSALGRALALAPDVEKAQRAARKTLDTIGRKSEIDPSSDEGIIPDENLKGQIQFKNVYFHYPSRPNVAVLRGLTLTIQPGETAVLVGHSGCGKSTLIQLLERYYDPVGRCADQISHPGKILIDGHDIRLLNLRWLRNQLGLVSQEPTLFNLTVRENILLGTEDTVGAEKVETDSRMIAAAKMANIHDFVSALPQGYNTKVGQRGGHLSGGQKQRICIARALYRQPAILLLDEATSALDAESEAVVQAAVDRAQEQCTSISIAHRLAAIVRSDSRIAVIDRGRVVETGNHDTLVAMPGGIYASLYTSSADVPAGHTSESKDFHTASVNSYDGNEFTSL